MNSLCEALEKLPATPPGVVAQLDAASAWPGGLPVISTDPPYYDNIGYADLSDFFYVWLRRSLKAIYPDLFSTLLVPKAQELIATPYRFDGDKKKAQEFFENGLGAAFGAMRSGGHPDYPLTVYYAFKQTEIGSRVADQRPSRRPVGRPCSQACFARASLSPAHGRCGAS